MAYYYDDRLLHESWIAHASVCETCGMPFEPEPEGESGPECVPCALQRRYEQESDSETGGDGDDE